MSDKKDFEQQKELLKIEAEADLKKHNYHLKELAVQKELEEFKLKSFKEMEEFKFQKQLEIQRIRSAEIKRTIQRQSDMKFMKDLGKNET